MSGPEHMSEDEAASTLAGIVTGIVDGDLQDDFGLRDVNNETVAPPIDVTDQDPALVWAQVHPDTTKSFDPIATDGEKKTMYVHAANRIAMLAGSKSVLVHTANGQVIGCMCGGGCQSSTGPIWVKACSATEHARIFGPAVTLFAECCFTPVVTHQCEFGHLHGADQPATEAGDAKVDDSLEFRIRGVHAVGARTLAQCWTCRAAKSLQDDKMVTRKNLHLCEEAHRRYYLEGQLKRTRFKGKGLKKDLFLYLNEHEIKPGQLMQRTTGVDVSNAE